MNANRIIGWCMVLLALFVSRSSATIYMADSFSGSDYTSGSLIGQNGGFGHSPWSWARWEPFVDTSSEADLLHPSVTSTGGSVFGSASTTITPSVSEMSPDGRSLYFSQLLMIPQYAGSPISIPIFEITRQYLPPDSIPPFPVNLPPLFGYVGDYEGSVVDGFFSIPTIEFYVRPHIANDIVHLVTRLDFGSNDSHSLSFYVNPSIDSEGNPDFVASFSADALRTEHTYLTVSYNSCVWGADEDVPARWDEIRVADSWADVVPEPSSVLMIVVGGCLLLARKRKRVNP